MGAWGDESCSSDSCWDCLYDGGIENPHKFTQKEADKAVVFAFSKQALKEYHHEPRLGVVITVLVDGKKVDKEYLKQAHELAKMLLREVVKSGYCSVKGRTACLEQEIRDIEEALAGDGSIPERHVSGLMEKIDDFITRSEQNA